MKTKTEIYVDFKAMMDQANKLEEIANELESLSNHSLNTTLEQIGGSWKGENAHLYLVKGETLKNNMEKSAKIVMQISENVAKRAKFIYDKEMEALRIARRRTYE